MEDSNGNDSEPEKVTETGERKVVRNAVDLQRIKVEKLMKNPSKPVMIPEIPKEKDFVYSVPTFVRNVMGSSAGAGSGEFHVYRNLRRKEYARQKIIEVKSHKDSLDQQYRDKIEKNRMDAEAKTAKKRAKRLKRKLKQKDIKKPKIQTEIYVNKFEDLTDSNEESEKESDKYENKLQSNVALGKDEFKEKESDKKEAKTESNVVEVEDDEHEESVEESEEQSAGVLVNASEDDLNSEKQDSEEECTESSVVEKK